MLPGPRGTLRLRLAEFPDFAAAVDRQHHARVNRCHRVLQSVADHEDQDSHRRRPSLADNASLARSFAVQTDKVPERCGKCYFDDASSTRVEGRPRKVASSENEPNRSRRDHSMDP